MTPIQICNIGLIAIGEAPVQSFDDVGRVSAECCKLVFRQCLEATLCDAPWNDASSSAALAAIDETEYRYQLPHDLLLLRTVESPYYPWRREGRELVTNATPPLRITYTRTLWQPTAAGGDLPITPLLASAVGYRVAASVALRVTGNPGSMQAAWQLYQAAIVKAGSVNAIENSGFVAEVGSWIDPEMPDYWDAGPAHTPRWKYVVPE